MNSVGVFWSFPFRSNLQKPVKFCLSQSSAGWARSSCVESSQDFEVD